MGPTKALVTMSIENELVAITNMGVSLASLILLIPRQGEESKRPFTSARRRQTWHRVDGPLLLSLPLFSETGRAQLTSTHTPLCAEERSDVGANRGRRAFQDSTPYLDVNSKLPLLLCRAVREAMKTRNQRKFLLAVALRFQS